MCTLELVYLRRLAASLHEQKLLPIKGFSTLT
jgi:hypothetical protein